MVTACQVSGCTHLKNLELNVKKFQKEFALRGGRGKNKILKYNSDLKSCQGVQQICFETGRPRVLHVCIPYFSP